MSQDSGLIRERVRFLGQPADKLRQVRGRELYDNLQQLGLTHAHYFRALETNVTDYCAQEFGVDLSRISVERFFQTDTDAKWLFPDLVREAVVAGLRRKPVYPDLIARDETISGTVYDVPYVAENAQEEELRTVAEGGAIPESAIEYGDRLVRLEKRGRGIVASYEVVRRMSIDMLRVHLQRIGERLGRSLDARLAHVLVNGDNSGSATAPVELNTATANTWTYADLVAAFTELAMNQYFTPTHMVADPATVQAVLNLSEIKDSALFDFAQTGNFPTPLGVKLTPLVDHPADKLTMLDAGFAVEKLTEHDVLIESDKLIHQQWDRTYITVVTDFAVVYENARVVLNANWS